MPTAYTAPIEEGTITDVKDYARVCARAFGAFITQRDESFSVAPRYPDAPTDGYRQESLKRAKRDLEEWNAMTEEDKYSEWSEYYNSSLVERAKINARYAVEHARYQAMLAQVLAIDVPSELANFKRFMVEQIEESDTHTNAGSYYTPSEYVSWCDQKEKMIARDVPYYEQMIQEEWDRYNETVKWIDLLCDTFGFNVEGDK